jgi:lipopolysaccharide/colanic/teichoic acid biosynthesis glycosyltransferase
MAMEATHTSTSARQAYAQGSTPHAAICTAGAPGLWRRAGGWAVLLRHHMRHGLRYGAKRLLDIVCGAIMVLLVSPIMICAALAIWIKDGRPIFFAGSRVGMDGRLFKMLKFRTMRRDAEAIARKIEEHKISATAGNFEIPQDESVLKLRHTLQKLSPSDQYHRDPRILPFGHFMRRFSVDELPQFFHIISGEMSLVGPRPLAAWEVADFTPRDVLRHKVTPGLTGPWQISDRKSLTHDQSIALDLQYAARQSLWYDLKILLLTVPVAFKNRAGN